MITIHHKTKSTQSRTKKSAFTLLELLVVIIIIGIIVSITMPMIGAANRAGTLESGVNEIASAITVARSIAIRDSTEAGVIFFRDPSSDNFLMRIVKRNGDSTTGRIGFTDLDDRPATVLPPYIRVAFPNMSATNIVTSSTDTWDVPGRYNYSSNGYTNKYSDTSNAVNGAGLGTNVDPWSTYKDYFYIVWFGPNGNIRTSHPSAPNPVLSHGPLLTVGTAQYDTANTIPFNCFYYDIPPTHNFFNITTNPMTGGSIPTNTPVPTSPTNTIPDDCILVPVPYLAVYDFRDAVDAFPGDIGNPTMTHVGTWLNGLQGTTQIATKARLFAFNRYTGQLIKSQ